MPAKKKTTRKTVAKKAPATKAPAKKVATKIHPCEDCERPRSTNDPEQGEKRSSGLLDDNTLCATCDGSGVVKVRSSK